MVNTLKPTLFVLAAGMGSRYGGLKQLDGVGPNGETIMDYSVFDAVRAGFGKIIFVIRHSFEAEFLENVVKKYEGIVPTELVFQEVEDVPEGFSYNKERERPWGTNHAILAGAKAIREPFAVINADDFYGTETFRILANYLTGVVGKTGNYCMVGYRVENTLSESGAVNRGVCTADSAGFLQNIVECTQIEQEGGVIQYRDEHGVMQAIAEGTPVSMNAWGFTPDYFDLSMELFKEFLVENTQSVKAEFYIPTAVDSLIRSGKAKVRVLDTPSKWFGVTYAADRQMVVIRLNELIKKGIYPNKLF